MVKVKHIHRFKVYFGDTDAAGIVYYPNFYKWMDQASAELVAKAVLPTSRLYKEEKILLPLLEAFCKFQSPLFFEDIVDVHSEVTEINSKTFRVEHVFKREEEFIAKGYEIKAWTRKKEEKLKAEPIPNDIRKKLEFDVESTIS
ncbi:acyl-CoA thioesterase [Virgibacillus sp. 19R1-5]|nr:4-hydroxybenzoyl-CoA thioesterase [Virgibacillus sp. 6R]MBS7429274.1 acyl-CoA thioesterase [Virgibacillus sp. 19R1-5]